MQLLGVAQVRLSRFYNKLPFIGFAEEDSRVPCLESSSSSNQSYRRFSHGKSSAICENSDADNEYGPELEARLSSSRETAARNFRGSPPTRHTSCLHELRMPTSSNSLSMQTSRKEHRRRPGRGRSRAGRSRGRSRSLGGSDECDGAFDRSRKKPPSDPTRCHAHFERSFNQTRARRLP